MAQFGTGYTSIGQYLDANRGTLDAERRGLGATVGDELSAAKAGDDQVTAATPHGSDFTTAPGYGDALAAQKAAVDDANLLGTQGGNATLLAKQYGKADPTYTPDKAGLDASLVGDGSFDGVKGQAKSLTGYLEATGATAGNSGAGPGGGRLTGGTGKGQGGGTGNIPVSDPPPAPPPPPDPTPEPHLDPNGGPGFANTDTGGGGLRIAPAPFPNATPPQPRGNGGFGGNRRRF